MATAVVGGFSVWNSQAQPTTTTIAGKAQTRLTWAAEPADRLDTAALGSALQAAQGRQAPPTTIPGVTCSPAERSWWKDPLAGPLITSAIGILTASPVSNQPRVAPPQARCSATG
ncbi:hypothetical protein OG239_05230 [Streptomyces sp. NBC_00868]|uniref:hypothetical protein n=1 Tax=Streptomyces sp. NBC_00868 TaxID=2903683 RepID=UPI00386B8A66|nr:hypothetical protein OG239_05230 [Streptomyces sp. NBC_00868]